MIRYKFGAVACMAGAYACNKFGHPVAQDALVVGAYCCSTAAAAVTASQSQGFVKAANKIGKGAVITGNGLVAAGKWAGYPIMCVGKYCTVQAKKALGKVTSTPHTSHAREISALSEIHNRMTSLMARYADEEDTPLLKEEETLEAKASE
jgi:hypothetical protein